MFKVSILEKNISGNNLFNNFIFLEGPAAEFVRPLENIEVTENNEAVFECQLSKEDTQVEWWFRGMPIVPSQHHLIASRGHIRQLIIPKVAMNDEGEYSIRVDNKNTSTAQLFVKGKYTK